MLRGKVWKQKNCWGRVTGRAAGSWETPKVKNDRVGDPTSFSDLLYACTDSCTCTNTNTHTQYLSTPTLPPFLTTPPTHIHGLYFEFILIGLHSWQVEYLWVESKSLVISSKTQGESLRHVPEHTTSLEPQLTNLYNGLNSCLLNDSILFL